MANKKIPTYNINSKGLKGNDPMHQIVECDYGWDIEGDVTFGSDIEVDGNIQVNTATDIVTKDGTSFGGWAQYRHTVTITDKINYAFSFTTLCSKNTPIDSIQDLTTLLGSTSIACTGFWIYDGQECIPYRIDIGTTIGTCYIQYFNKGDNEMQSDALSTIATDMIMLDNVTQD